MLLTIGHYHEFREPCLETIDTTIQKDQHKLLQGELFIQGNACTQTMFLYEDECSFKEAMLSGLSRSCYIGMTNTCLLQTV